MTNTDKQFSKWVNRASLFLPYVFRWNNSATKGAYSLTYKDKTWDPLFMGDLPQLAQDLGIFDKMYSSADAVPVVQEAQPETFIVFNPDNDMWFLTVMGVTFCVSGEIAGKMLNAGCEYRKYQPR